MSRRGVADDVARKEQAIALLAGGMARKEVAEKLKVRPETISRWLGDPAFRLKLEAAVASVREEATYGLRRALAKAVEVLIEELEAEAPHDRIRAALAILDRNAGFAAKQQHEVSLTGSLDVEGLSAGELRDELLKLAEQLKNDKPVEGEEGKADGGD